MHIREPSRVLVIPVQFSSHTVDYPRQSRSDLLPYQPVLSGMGSEVLRWEEARGCFLSFLIYTPSTDKYPRRTFSVWLLEVGLQEQSHPAYPQLQAELNPLPRLKLCTFVSKSHLPVAGSPLSSRNPSTAWGQGWIPGQLERRCKWSGRLLEKQRQTDAFTLQREQGPGRLSGIRTNR